MEQVWLLLAVGYLTEPIMSQVYMRSILAVGEKTLASMRRIVFRVILHQEIDFFDRNRTSDLTSTMAVDMNILRSFIFGNVTRDRGVRAFLEASGAVIILCYLSWQLGPMLAGKAYHASCSSIWFISCCRYIMEVRSSLGVVRTFMSYC